MKDSTVILTKSQKKELKRRENKAFDFDFIHYNITEKLATITFILYLLATTVLIDSYTIIFGIKFKFTLASVLMIIAALAGTIYVIGAYEDMQKKTYFKILLIPLLIPILELGFHMLLTTNFKISINYKSYLVLIISYIILCIINYINYTQTEVTHIIKEDINF